jgi:hypothetical protein
MRSGGVATLKPSDRGREPAMVPEIEAVDIGFLSSSKGTLLAGEASYVYL